MPVTRRYEPEPTALEELLDALNEGAIPNFVIAALSGLTDMDAITLSTARLVTTGRLEADNGWRLILTALLANVVFKGGLVALLGDRRLLARIAPLSGIVLVGGTLVLWLWPAM